MTSAAGNGVFLDTTILRFAKDLRGIHQVVFRMVEVLAGDPRFAGTRFVAAEGTYGPYLEPLGVRRESVVEMPAAPLLGRYERFHGLFSTRRYRGILAEKPQLLIHAELRSVVGADVAQAICYYDFIELEEPAVGRGKWDRRAYYRYKSNRAAKVAHKMSISEFTRRRALEIFPGMAPDSVRTVHLGVRQGIQPVAATRSSDLQPPACLYVGSYEVRKNIPSLVSRFREASGDTGAILHLAGHASPETQEQILALAEAAGLSERVKWHGLVTDEQLRALYASSHFLLFPSLKEGFGLPLAEAMSHGLVVCAFDNSSIPEVMGGTGVLARDGDFRAWGDAIAGMVREPDRYLAQSAQSRERARYFSPEAARSRLTDWFLGIFRAAGAPLAEGSRP